jgi:hypothetical protein
MQGKMIVIQPNGDVSVQTLSRVPPLDDLQAVVGGSIELLPLFETFRDETGTDVPCAAFVDEEGMFKGCEVNVKATQLWAAAMVRSGYLTAVNGRVEIDDVVKGTCLILTGDKEFMEKI